MSRQRTTWGAAVALFSLLTATLVLAVPSAASASVLAPGATQKVSRDAGGNQGSGGDTDGKPSLSANGNVVAFHSDATNLVPNDTNGVRDIFVRDLAANTIERVSTDSAGAQADNSSSSRSEMLSADGRYVAFVSSATNLLGAGNDTNARADIFVKDRTTGAVKRANINETGGVTNNANASNTTSLSVTAIRFALSANGRYLVFNAPQITATGAPQTSRLYIRDLVSDTTDVLSKKVDGSVITSNAAYEAKSITPDGRFVLFSSTSAELAATDTDVRSDLFVRDRTAPDATATELVNVADGTTATHASLNPPTDTGSADISDNGNVVVFGSTSPNLVAPIVDNNGTGDIFVRDRTALSTKRASVDASGAEGASGAISRDPAISGDGTRVAFASAARLLVADTNLVVGGNAGTDIYVRNLPTNSSSLESVSSTGVQGTTDNGVVPNLSSDGSTVGFVSFDPNLDTPGPQANYQEYVRSLVPALSATPSTVTAGNPVTATWSNITGPSATDWVGLYDSPSAPDAGMVTWAYTGGAAAGTKNLTVPLGATPGATYELRLFTNNTYSRLSTSAPITVIASATTVSASPASVVAGGPVTATWSAIAGPAATDWVGVYPNSSTPDAGVLAWAYTGGAAGGNLNLTVPAGSTPGATYELRLFANNTYTRLATSAPFSVTASATTLSASPASVNAGSPVTATWSAIASPNATDWVGLYATGTDPDPATLAWAYTGGSASGNLNLTVPVGAASGAAYELRLFSNNTYTRMATSAPFSVTASAATVSASPSSVVNGNPVTANWSAIGSPTATDWVGLYANSTDPNPAIVAWAYTGGAAAGSLNLVVPLGSTPGAAYELRLFSNNTYTRLATSAPFTVT